MVVLFQSHTQECFLGIDSPEFEPLSSNPNSHTFHCLKLGEFFGRGGVRDMRKESERKPLHYIRCFVHAYFPFKNLSTLRRESMPNAFYFPLFLV